MPPPLTWSPVCMLTVLDGVQSSMSLSKELNKIRQNLHLSLIYKGYFFTFLHFKICLAKSTMDKKVLK